jgi:peroxiredoxin
MARWRAFQPVVPFLAAIVALAPLARAETGQADRVVPDLTLPLAKGGAAPLVERSSRATALVFFKDGHERSTDTLKMLAACRSRLAKEPVRLVGVVPADSAEGAAMMVQATGLDLPVLVDKGDEAYAALGVRAHPVIAVVDARRKVVAFEPYHQVAYCDIVVARVQRALGEIGDAEVEKALAPPATQLPGDAPGAVAHRHVALARRLLAARSFGAAHDSARKALALTPSVEAWKVEGEVFAAEGKCPDALRAFDAALALDPKDAGVSAARQACGR